VDSRELSVIPEKAETDQIMATEGNRILVLDDGASLIGFAYARTYELDSQAALCIKDKSTIIEGYAMTFFVVYLISGEQKIRFLSTNSLKEARHIQSQITEFLKKAIPLPLEGE
jgi:hypothetical protein